MILKSPQSPPAAACLLSFFLVCSDTEPPPHAVSASAALTATTAIRARRFLSCRTVPTPLFLCRVALRDLSCAWFRGSRAAPSSRVQPRPPSPPDRAVDGTGARACPVRRCSCDPVDEDAE